MKCNECNKQMVKVDRREEMVDLDEDATEGQSADYYAAELSGDMGDWQTGIVEYLCERCDLTIELISDSLQDYKSLITGWHRKAMQGDYFSRYVFEYLAFAAHLKAGIAMGAFTDRMAVQMLKRNNRAKEHYLARIGAQADLKEAWHELIRELSERALHNSSRDYDNPEIDGWWNNHADKKEDGTEGREGVVIDLGDWDNMVEFWYGVRNNLFHGGKDINVQRDCFLIEHAFKTLNAFMKLQLGG